MQGQTASDTTTSLDLQGDDRKKSMSMWPTPTAVLLLLLVEINEHLQFANKFSASDLVVIVVEFLFHVGVGVNVTGFRV